LIFQIGKSQLSLNPKKNLEEFLTEIKELSYILEDENIQIRTENTDRKFDFPNIGIRECVTKIFVYSQNGLSYHDTISSEFSEYVDRVSDIAKKYNWGTHVGKWLNYSIGIWIYKNLIVFVIYLLQLSLFVYLFLVELFLQKQFHFRYMLLIYYYLFSPFYHNVDNS